VFVENTTTFFMPVFQFRCVTGQTGAASFVASGNRFRFTINLKGHKAAPTPLITALLYVLCVTIKNIRRVYIKIACPYMGMQKTTKDKKFIRAAGEPRIPATCFWWQASGWQPGLVEIPGPVCLKLKGKYEKTRSSLDEI
jgi:hypothetical protein